MVAIWNAARRGEPETIKPGDRAARAAEFQIIGNRLTAVEGARRAAERLGYAVRVLPDATHGEAREAARAFLAEATRLC